MNIPTSHQDMLKDEVQSFAFLATVMPDGTPQVTPVWFSWDGQDVYINTARGRVKDRNMRARPSIALTIPDPQNPYRYLQLRGQAVEVPDKDARAHINFLSNKYLGNPTYPGDPSEVRVIYRIQVEKAEGYD